jgi:hypothetical protein
VKRIFLCWMFSLLSIPAVFLDSAKAQDENNQVILPAGTLLRCTLNEPNFSSKTAEVGDPVVCPLVGVLLSDRAVLPRGAYLGGHLEAEQDPGHFFGKGYLKLEFDHIGLPNEEVPVPAKIIGASGYKVDRQGKIVGHGHATRDLVEWMMPPLWPVKVLTLPARGPRPTLKGEERLTLRLMEDVAIRSEPLMGWYSIGSSSSEDSPHANDAVPGRYAAPQVLAPAGPSTANNLQVAGAAKVAASSGTSAVSAIQNVLVLRDGTTSLAKSLHVDGDQLSYTLADGTLHAVKLDEVDWTRTFESNTENGAAFALTSASAAH